MSTDKAGSPGPARAAGSDVAATAASVVVAVDDPRAADVRSLLERHLSFNRANTPPEGVFALDVERLLDPAVTFVSARVDGALVGVGALKHLSDTHAELKSMHTSEAMRGRGVARAVLDHLVAMAAERGYHRVSLETGNMDAFAPARRLYANAGFEECPPFGDYVGSATSTCMTRWLDQG